MIKITKSGKIYIFIMMIVGVVSILHPRVSLYFLTSIMFSIFILSGILARKNIEYINIDFIFPNEIYTNKECEILITINNIFFLPLFLIEINIFNSKNVIFIIPPKTTITHKIKFKFKNRGTIIITQKDINICSLFPFGFVKRCLKFNYTKELTIFAAQIPFKYKDLSITNKSQSNQALKKLLNSDYSKQIKKIQDNTAINHIRDYIKGDNPKYIHQKASAKSNKLKIKEFNYNQQQTLIIDFDNIKINNLEEKISKLTYLINKYSKENKMTYFIYNNKAIQLTKESRLKILSILARI